MSEGSFRRRKCGGLGLGGAPVSPGCQGVIPQPACPAPPGNQAREKPDNGPAVRWASSVSMAARCARIGRRVGEPGLARAMLA
jgi:hypothetical protein